MKTTSVADAWSLAPIGNIRLGTRDVPIPPLTFSRFQRLLSLPTAELVRAMTTGDVAAAAPWAEVVLPGLSRAEWNDFATPATIGKLFLAFAKGHDWSYIGEAIRFGEPPDEGEEPPTPVMLAAGLLGMARASGYTITELTDMRLEGFHLLVEVLRGQPRLEEGGVPFGFEYVPPGESTPLFDLLKKADEARGVGEAGDGRQ